MTPYDVAFGRLAAAQGLVAPEALRAAAQALGPGAPLAGELVRRGLLAPTQAAALDARLRALGPRALASTSSGAWQTPPASASPASASPPSAPPASASPAAGEDGVATVAGAASPAPGSARPGDGLPGTGDLVDGRFEVGALLGRGGMGAVYRARDRATGDEVALKLMLADADPDGAALQRFQREAQAVARVDAHAGVVRVRALGRHAGRVPYAAMDLVVGRDLKALVRERGPLPVAEALDLAEQVARAVQHCHDKGVLHRDLKPANVLLRAADGRPLVTDFGLALDRSAERLTRTGEVLGTPAYMPPEQAEGAKDAVDARSDVYALGAVLYELVTGRPPFTGDAVQILKKVFVDPPAPVATLRPDAPADVDVICQKALAKEPDRRYPTAAAFADDVARLRRGEPIEARAPTRRELLRWRARRGDWRALLVLRAPLLVAPLALGALGAAGIAGWQSWRRGQDAERFAAAAAGVTAHLAATWPARLAGAPPPRADEATDASRGADLVRAHEALEGLPPAAALDEAALVGALAAVASRCAAASSPGPPAAADVLRLRRRLALAAALDDAAWAAQGLGLEAPPGPDDPEACAVWALRALGWRRGLGRAPRWDPEVTAALALLGRVPRGPPAADACAALARALKAADAAALADLRAGAREVEALLAGWPRVAPAVAHGVPAPPAWARLEAGATELPAARRAAVARRGPEVADALLAGVAALVSQRVVADLGPGSTRVDPAYQRAEPWQALGNVCRAVRDALRAWDPAAPAPEGPLRALCAAVQRRPIALTGADVRVVGGAGFGDGSDAPILELLLEADAELPGGVELDPRMLDVVMAACQRSVELRRVPPPQVLVLLPRLGLWPHFANFRDRLPELVRAVEGYVEAHPTRDGYLTLHRVWRAGDGVDERRDPRAIARALDLLSSALGDHLDAGRRAALRFPPPRPTGPGPLAARYRAWATAWAIVLRLRLDALGPAPSAPLLDAGLRALEEVLARPDELRDPTEVQKLLAEGANLLGWARADPDAPGALAFVDAAGAPLDAAARRACRERERAWWLRARGQAWALVDSARVERRAGADGPSLAGLEATELDLDRTLKMGLRAALRNEAQVLDLLGRSPEALDLYREALARLRALRLPLTTAELDLRLDHARRERALGHAAEAEAAAREVVTALARVDDPDPADRRSRLGSRSEARALLARLALDRGDRAEARAALAEATAAGDLEVEDARMRADWKSLQDELAGP